LELFAVSLFALKLLLSAPYDANPEMLYAAAQQSNRYHLYKEEELPMQQDTSFMMLALGGVAILAALYQIIRSIHHRLLNVATVLMMVGLLLPDVANRWPGLLSAGDHRSTQRFLLTTAILLMFTDWLYERYRKGQRTSAEG
jgi:hypothetical protein